MSLNTCQNQIELRPTHDSISEVRILCPSLFFLPMPQLLRLRNSLTCAPHLTKSLVKTSSFTSDFCSSIHPSQSETEALGINKHPYSVTQTGTDVLLPKEKSKSPYKFPPLGPSLHLTNRSE